MLKTAMRIAVVVLACALLSGDAAAKLKAEATTRKTTAGAAFFAGELSFAIVDGTVELTARGAGLSSPWGAVVAEASWAPTIDRVMDLLAGNVEELSIATGTFSAEFADGDALGGTLSGTIRPRGDGTFALEADFVATRGTGDFSGVTGGGSLRALDDISTLEFRAMLHAKLSVPK
jgi:hypothetical protein